MKNIYSKIDGKRILHTVYRLNDLKEDREDFTSEDKYLQGAVIKFNKGKKFKAHQHIHCERTTDITQETWVVIEGSVLVKYYDLDDQYLTEETINSGDCTITFAGGHSFEGIDENTIVYEFKSGPYYGRNADKVDIMEETQGK